MKIISLEITNFLTIGNAKLNLDNKGLVLVQGVNNDDKSALSNGAGKSSIPDALCWGLYGMTARGISADDVVNEVAKKDCSVVVVVEDAGYRYSIARYRKSTGAIKTGTRIYQNNIASPLEPAVHLTKGTEKETQELINTILGCTYEVFTASVYAAQEMMPDLPGMTDKMLKQLIESSSGTERLAFAFEKAKEERYAIAATCMQWTNKSNDLKNNIDAERNELPVNKLLIDDWQENLQAKVDKMMDSAVEVLKLAKKNKADNIDTVDEAELAASHKALVDKIKEHDKYPAKLKVLQLEAQQAESELSSRKGYSDTLAIEIERISLKIASLEKTVGTPCGECGKLYCNEDLSEVKALRESELVEYKTKYADSLLVSANAAVEFNAKKKVADDFEASIPNIVALLTLNDEFLKRKLDLSAAKTNLDYQKKTIGSLKDSINAAKKEPNPYIAIEERVILGIKTLESRLVKSTEEEEQAKQNLAIAESVVKVFGPAGVRARILDTVTPYLNARTSDYLSALSDGNISAVWTTIQRNKAGELREKFGIDVTNDKGAKSFKGLSGGEKRKVRLSCALALQDLVSSRATKSIPLMIADEIDDALDDAGLERLMGILDEKAKDGGTILVISHNSLSDWCDQILTVTKEDGIATISGVTVGS